MTPALENLLGSLPPHVAALPREHRELVAELVVQARERQAAAADTATDIALRGVPLPVRGLIRKALLG